MSYKDFHNGLLVGMTIKGKTGTEKGPVPVVVYNGFGSSVTSYVIVVFDKELNTSFRCPMEAFAVSGYFEYVGISYPITEVGFLDSRRIYVKTSDYKEDDGAIDISFDNTLGSIRGLDNAPVKSFFRTFFMMGTAPKAKVKETYYFPLTMVSMSNLNPITQVNAPKLIVPIQSIGINQYNYSIVSINNLNPQTSISPLVVDA